jgi:hypothetical protein
MGICTMVKEPTFQKGFSYNKLLHALNTLINNVCVSDIKQDSICAG